MILGVHYYLVMGKRQKSGSLKIVSVSPRRAFLLATVFSLLLAGTSAQEQNTRKNTYPQKTPSSSLSLASLLPPSSFFLSTSSLVSRNASLSAENLVSEAHATRCEQDLSQTKWSSTSTKMR